MAKAKLGNSAHWFIKVLFGRARALAKTTPTAAPLVEQILWWSRFSSRAETDFEKHLASPVM